MTRIIKFALELKDGESARTIEDLRAHFDLEKVVAYFMNGRLLMWLRHRHLDTEADAVERLSTEDAELAKKLCEILGVAYESHQLTADAINATALMADHERLSRLRQITSDPELLAKIDRVAFDEKDLRRLAFDNEPEVYLCNGRFVIPLNVQNKHYIGIGKAEAVIVSEEWIDFAERHIRFTNVAFDEEYQKIADAETPEKWLKKGDAAYDEGNYVNAVQWYKKAADAGNGEAMNAIGDMYYNGEGVPKDYTEAMKWYQQSANVNYGDAMLKLGNIYHDGDGIEQDDTEAIRWYRKAADAGNSAAMNNLGNRYYRGEGVAQDYFEAVKWYQKSADAGFPEGMGSLGRMYFAGFGVERNLEKALELYKRAEKNGVNDCAYLIGIIYEEQNKYTDAISWYMKAAKSGNAHAMAALAGAFYDGQGVVQDDWEARKWCQQAAEKGHAGAMYMLGVMYYNGEGGPENQTTARYWIQKAADAGDENAKEWIAES